MSNDSYLYVDINSILKNHATDFNLYIMYEDNYVLFKSSDLAFTEKHKEKLLTKKLKLYIANEDKVKYLKYVKKNLKNLFDNKAISIEEKTKYYYDTSKVLISQIFDGTDTEDLSDNVKTLSNSALNILNSSGYNLKNILSIMDFEYSTYTHSINVLMLSSSFFKTLGIMKDKAESFARGALLHDIGKSKVDKKILLKPGKLDQFEWEIIRKHPEYGVEIMQKYGNEIDSVGFNIIRHHHEKFNGEGYPDKLKGNDIPVEAQIVSICDVFDALTSQRCYKTAIGSYPAFEIMLKEMSPSFNNDLLIKFLSMFKEAK